MELAVTDGIYSKDNYEPSLCALSNGRACWMAWAAYERDGSRAFVRRFDGEDAGEVTPISPSKRMQTRPICVPMDTGVRFVWFEKEGQTYSIWSREHGGDAFTGCEELAVLPESAKPWELQALCDESGTLWVTWAQSVKNNSSIEVFGFLQGSEPVHFSLGNESRYNYRPRMVAWKAEGIYLIWDSYVDEAYDIYGCPVLPSGPSEVVKISCDAAWENKSAICRDRDGALWAVWVRWQDVMYRQSTIQQKFSVRGARLEGDSWEPLLGADGGSDIAPLHYGLLTDFPRLPNLGHIGRRLFPILKGAEDGGVWLFYEVKADQDHHTLLSKGRMFAHRCVDGTWSGPYTVREGRVFYELPHNNSLSTGTFLISRDFDSDELYLEKVDLSADFPVVPEEKRSVNLEQWEEIRLPFKERRETDRASNELPGETNGKYQLFWADLHCHSAVSIEMEGEPDELGHFARDKAQIDALTVSDNDNFWDRFRRNQVRHLKDYEWDYVKGNALLLNEPGRFAMFPGYEMGTGGDNSKPGAKWKHNHRSVMSDDDEMEMDLLNFKYIDAYMREERETHKEIQECIAWCREREYLPLPHPHDGHWNLVDTDVEWGIDVCAAWMINMDLFDIYFKYLDAGHKFAFTGSGDSHHRNPGLSGAITGIWADRLDRASLLEAIKARRCFATAGQRILIEFTINDHMMGSSLVMEEDPVLKWRVVGEENQDYILRIHRDGRLMHEDRFVGQTRGELEEYRLCQYRPGKHYYYLEVLSPDPIPQYPANVAHALGAKGWSTPIWIETTN